LKYEGISLSTLNKGAVLELFGVEWQKLLDNISDPNTKPEAARKLKIEIAVKPQKDRRNALCSVSATTNLAAIIPHEASIVIGVEDGKVTAYAFDPGQHGLEFDEDADNVKQFRKEA
jgi:hypothetical protein